MNNLDDHDQKIDQRNIEDIISLTPLQQGMLFHYLKDPGGDHYFEQLCLEICGEIQHELFEKAWNFVIESNEMLRTIFRWKQLTQPAQVILNHHKLHPVIYDFSKGTPGEIRKQLEDLNATDRKDTFDLNRVPFRVILCKTGKAKYEMIISNHHILYDGWSSGIILKEFFNAYDDLSDGKIPVKPEKTKFKHFVHWLKAQDEAKQESFWRSYLEGGDTVRGLPVRTTGRKRTATWGNFKLTIKNDLCNQLRDFVHRYKITNAILFYAAWSILLQKYNNSDDLMFGTTVSGRSADIKDIESMVGLFINTLPLRVQIHPGDTIMHVLYRINKTLLLREPYASTSLVKIKEYSRLTNNRELFDSIVVLENYPLDKALKQQNNRLDVNSFSVFEKSNYDLNISITFWEDIELNFGFYQESFAKEVVERLSSHFLRILQVISTDPYEEIYELDILSGEEKKQVLFDFNNTGRDYPAEKTISQLFSGQVAKTPDSIAVIGPLHTGPARQELYNHAKDNIQITYKQLSIKADQLARLLKENSVRADVVVALMVERSLEMIVGISGILKAGGVYLPVDPGYPAERIRYMLADSNAAVFLSAPGDQHPLKIGARGSSVQAQGLILQVLDDMDIRNNIPLAFTAGCRNSPGSPAYVIYTSGSTGKSKGVMVVHRSVVRLVKNNNFIEWQEGDRLLQTGALVFDISTFEIWGPLLNGAVLHQPGKSVLLDAGKLEEEVIKNKITLLHLVPQLFNQLVAESLEIFRPLRGFLVGGDLVSPGPINRLRQKYRGLEILHLYGPTENTTFSTFFPVNRECDGKIPIGKPVSNSTVYITDHTGLLTPIGVPGELSVGGSGLARGYLNNPELTAEKFLLTANRFHWSDEDNVSRRIYLTGDLARWLPDGNIEFLGRIDSQVKIKGIRIELNEIEQRLLTHDHIKEVIATAIKDRDGSKFLCAYFISDREPTPGELRDYLSQTLPDYMLPSYFMRLENIPLTPNGKLDRKNLPHPEAVESAGSVDYVPPQHPVEIKLAGIWEAVLNKKTVGITDNFFEIGGDSIKAIQVAAQMNKAGYRLEINDLLQYPSIAQLVPLVKKQQIRAKQSEITGFFFLTPVQREFFSFPLDSPHHFCMYVMLRLEKGIETQLIKTIFTKIQEHHDALRITFKKEKKETGNQGIIQVNHGVNHPLSLQVFYLEHEKRPVKENVKENPMKILDRKIEQEQILSAFSLEKGPLMKLALFHQEEQDHLLIAIHHLLIDGVSWRILLEDIQTLYRQYKTGKPLVLPPKSDSYRRWAVEISQYADSELFLNEKPYWRRLEDQGGNIPPIKKDFIGNENYLKDTRTQSFSLSEDETRDLLTKVHYAFGTKINDILLLGLGLGTEKTFGNNRILVALEGHGREEIFKNLDFNRTIGWFTCVYPVIIDAGKEKDLTLQIIEMKEYLRRIPNNGIGYGILKYVTAQHLKGDLEFQLNPQIVFNYMGQFDEQSGNLSMGKIEKGILNSVDINEKRKYELDVSGIVKDQRLIISVSYSSRQYRTQTIAALLHHYQEQLRHLINFCLSQSGKRLTPYDFTYTGLSMRQVEELSKRYDLEDIYSLSPMQEGILFHTLKGDDFSYFTQISCRLQGELDIRVVEAGFNLLFERHGLLRTVFIYEGVDIPLQAVLKHRQEKIYFKDLRGLPAGEEKNSNIEEFKVKDRQRSFDLSNDALLRLGVFRLEDRTWEIVWSFHHILFDGWSVGLVHKEFFDIYHTLKNNRHYNEALPAPFRVYIRWLENLDNEKAGKYWEKYLENYREIVGIPAKKDYKSGKPGYKTGTFSVVLDREKTNGLKRLAQSCRATLNNVFQALWGVILIKYTGRQDLVFGSVVSGRSAQIQGVETMIGCFINTIPVRIRLSEEDRFSDMVKNLLRDEINSLPYQHFPLYKIQARTSPGQNLFNHIYAFENHLEVNQIEKQGEPEEPGQGSNQQGPTAALQISDIEIFDQDNFDLDMVIAPGEQVTVMFQYNAHVYDSDTVRKLGAHLEEVSDAVIENHHIEVKSIMLSHQLSTIETGIFNDMQDDFKF